MNMKSRLFCGAVLLLFSLHSNNFMLLLFTVENGLLRLHLYSSWSLNEIPTQTEKGHCRQYSGIWSALNVHSLLCFCTCPYLWNFMKRVQENMRTCIFIVIQITLSSSPFKDSASATWWTSYFVNQFGNQVIFLQFSCIFTRWKTSK